MKCKIDCEKTEKEVYPPNTHWSACGTVRIKVAYGKVPLWAKVGEGAVMKSKGWLRWRSDGVLLNRVLNKMIMLEEKTSTI